MSEQFTDYLIECGSPVLLDAIIQKLGTAMLMQDSDNSYPKNSDGHYTMRVIGDPGYIKFALEQQGYGKIIREVEE